MFSADGFDGQNNSTPIEVAADPCGSVEFQLWESLVHHLIEKGVLTKNDALGVVQTVAQVKRGELEEGRAQTASASRDLAALRRLYSSFELVTDRPLSNRGQNVRVLRPPLHGDRPEFPRDD